jgi:hypothetical protein
LEKCDHYFSKLPIEELDIFLTPARRQSFVS